MQKMAAEAREKSAAFDAAQKEVVFAQERARSEQKRVESQRSQIEDQAKKIDALTREVNEYKQQKEQSVALNQSYQAKVIELEQKLKSQKQVYKEKLLCLESQMRDGLMAKDNELFQLNDLIQDLKKEREENQLAIQQLHLDSQAFQA